MVGNESWIYQGRQTHGWFGHGTEPQDTVLPPTNTRALFDPTETRQRVSYVLSSILGHIPRLERPHWAAAMSIAPADAWTAMAQTWQAAAGLDRHAFRDRFLDPYTTDIIIDSLRHAASGMVIGQTYDDLAAAGQDLATAAQQVDPNSWPCFISDAGQRAAAAPPDNTLPTQDIVRALDVTFHSNQPVLHLIADDQRERIETVGKQLRDIAQDIVDTEQAMGTSEGIPPNYSAATYGTYLHKLFAWSVKAAQIPGVSVEQSFITGESVHYGKDNSIRTDVILRDGKQVIAVWDYKTGRRTTMSVRRQNEIFNALQVKYGTIPIIIIEISTDIIWGR